MQGHEQSKIVGKNLFLGTKSQLHSLYLNNDEVVIHLGIYDKIDFTVLVRFVH